MLFTKNTTNIDTTINQTAAAHVMTINQMDEPIIKPPEHRILENKN